MSVPEAKPPWPGLLRVGAYVVLGAAAVAAVGLGLRPTITGDGLEYVGMTASLAGHGWPDLRPEGVAELRRLVPWFRGDEVGGFFASPVDGRLYSWHFWLYPLACVPAWGLLRLLGHDGAAALQMTNVAALWAAGYALLFAGDASRTRRLATLGLNLTLPTLLYVYWSGPEAFTWALVVAGLALLDARRHALGAACVALGATQNPPLVFLAGFVAAMALRERGWRAGVAAALASTPALAPIAFNLALFRVPSLIAAHGNHTGAHLSAARVGSFFFDLNQGILPYAPLTLPLAAWGLARALGRRSEWFAAAGGAAALAAVVAVACTAPNWNSGSIFLIRYAVWTLPVLVWLALRWLPEAAVGGRAVRAAVGAQWLASAFALGWLPAVSWSLPHTAAFHGPLADAVLRFYPAWYDPDPEIFAERLRHSEAPQDLALPLAFLGNDGSATKILVDAASVDRLAERFHLPPGFVERARQKAARRAGPFYLHPYPGRVFPKPPSTDLALKPTP